MASTFVHGLNSRNDNIIPATVADETSTFEFEKRTIKVSYWHDLVLSNTPVFDNAITFSIYMYDDQDYKNPLILATDVKPKMARTPYLLYNDRWTAEHPPLAAKQMIGLHRHFVFALESCFGVGLQSSYSFWVLGSQAERYFRTLA